MTRAERLGLRPVWGVAKATFFAPYLLGGLMAVCCATRIQAEKYTPEHPVVQAMVAKGVKFLSGSQILTSGESPVEGVEILVAYTVFKVDSEPTAPAVVRGINAAKRLARAVSDTNYPPEAKSVYIISLAGMLLASVDVDAHGESVKAIRDFLLRIQKPHGGFGYMVGGPYFETGDISQTQYVMLALWTISQSGIEVPEEPIIKAINFLTSGQQLDGGWPYQYSGTGQMANGATASLAAAGLSALLIAGDMLNLYRNRAAESDDEDDLVPAAFKRILPESERKKQTNLDRTRIDLAAQRGEAWHRMNPYTTRAAWHYYYIYSKERFESFLEITKRKQVKSPDWYNEGVEELIKFQAASGGWGIEADKDYMLAPEIATSFALLFLIRSTQKAIGQLNEGFLEGGFELPSDLASVKAVNGKVISKSQATSVDDALKMLEDDQKSAVDDALIAEKMILSKDPAQRKEELNRFARLLNSKDYIARRIAAKLLGRGDDLDLAPRLIYALTDPDPEVPRIAEGSLRLLSRQLDLYHLPKDTKPTDSDRSRAAAQWKKWYLQYRPDHVFVD